ncbi:uncharacterized protein MAM_07492 [Metarhizium album ARSEF 1941]|uniref:C2H2-type domain-containing protein n=1 Tax=Metarhizium album (strain ARSEF 1941) TaxID=1081103 RepID=A0A0B2WF93_METAS|nr:uncharacterized protein MAM_07492 [Metarhizium album ARSEF 1941]KHN94586.1 hypothetical protein MAM_07492 [Metarhizium album ARSEF 1941]
MPDKVIGPNRTKEPGPQPYRDLIYCLYPGCHSQGFRQGVDLEEHYKSAHIPSVPVPGGKSARMSAALDPFDRLDVFLDTLQKNADVDKAADEESTRSTDSLQQPTKQTAQAGWRWRCAKCSQIIDLDCYGYVCPFCRQT